MTEAIAVLSFEEFCDAEDRSEQRRELVSGPVYAMAGGSERHDFVARLIYEVVTSRARASGCPVRGEPADATMPAAYYPDVMVVCGRPPIGSTK